MSYHIYQTEGFIIESTDSGEASKMLTMFTKDLGLIRASAQGIRHLRSKLRYSLQELSFSTIAVVRGKEMWRVTNARKLISLNDKRLPLAVRKMLARVLVFVKRLMPEEGKNEELFELLSTLSSFCFAERDVFLNVLQPQTDFIDSAEVLTKLRVLRLLGYGTNQKMLSPFVASSQMNKMILESIIPLQYDARVEIDKALSESQL